MAATALITAAMLQNSGHMHTPLDTNKRTGIPTVRVKPTPNISIFHASRLEIELSPLAEEWMSIIFGTRYYNFPKMVIADVNDAREQGLYGLPFRRIDEVVVRLYAPMSDNPGQLFVLFDRVVNLVDMLRRAPVIQKMSIVLESLDGQEWHHESVTVRGERESFFAPWADDSDMVVVPFCSLKNVGGVCVHAHSRELERLIDWKVIDWAVGVVRGRSWEAYVPGPTRARRFDTTTYYASYTHRPDRSTPGTDVDRKVAEYYLRVHVNLLRHDFRDTGRHQRRDLLRRSFAYSSATTTAASPSSFERDMVYIAENYPDLLRKYDRAIEVLLHLQRIIVCTYGRTKPRADTDKYIDTRARFDDWDEAAWRLVERAFGDPLPVMGSLVFEECAGELGSLVDYNECLERVREVRGDDWLMGVVRVGQFVQDWVRVFVYGEEDEGEYGEYDDEENEDVDEEDAQEDEEGEEKEEEDEENEGVENEAKYEEVDKEEADEEEERLCDDGEDQDEGDGENENEEEQKVVEDDKKEDNDEGEVEDEGEAYYEEDDDDWDFCECCA